MVSKDTLGFHVSIKTDIHNITLILLNMILDVTNKLYLHIELVERLEIFSSYGEIQLNLLSQYNNLSTIVSPSAIEKWPDKRVAFSGRGL